MEHSYKDPFVFPIDNSPQYIDEEVDLPFSDYQRPASELSNCLDRFRKGFNFILNNYRRSGQKMPALSNFYLATGLASWK